MCFFQLIQAKTKTNELIIHNDSKADTSCSNTLEAVKGGGGRFARIGRLEILQKVMIEVIKSCQYR